MSGERPKTHEPFSLLTKTQDVSRPVTLADVSEQVGALSSHLGAVHREVALTRSELGELRKLVTGDHAPRITRVEEKTSSLPRGVKVGVGGGAVAGLTLLIEWLYPIAVKWLESK